MVGYRWLTFRILVLIAAALKHVQYYNCGFRLIEKGKMKHLLRIAFYKISHTALMLIRVTALLEYVHLVMLQIFFGDWPSPVSAPVIYQLCTLLSSKQTELLNSVR